MGGEFQGIVCINYREKTCVMRRQIQRTFGFGSRTIRVSSRPSFFVAYLSHFFDEDPDDGGTGSDCDLHLVRRVQNLKTIHLSEIRFSTYISGRSIIVHTYHQTSDIYLFECQGRP